MPLKILFAGSGEFGRPTLDLLVSGRHEIVHVYTQPDRPAGRGRTLTPTPIAEYCLRNHLPLTRTEKLNNESLPRADVLVVIAFGQKISQQVANHPRLGSINLHASLLPKYRGAAPINWAIIRGDQVLGNSIIRLAEKMDAGAILAQQQVPLQSPTDTAGEMHDLLACQGGGLVRDTLDALEQGAAVETPQDELKATVAPKLSRELSRLDWSKPAAELSNLLRGLSPWPGCRVRLLDGEKEIAKVTLLRSTPHETSTDHPGQIIPEGWIATGEGAVEILELQPEGKRPMSLKEFQNGKPWREGMRVESI